MKSDGRDQQGDAPTERIATCASIEAGLLMKDGRIPQSEEKRCYWKSIPFRWNTDDVNELIEVHVDIVKTVYGNSVTCTAKFDCWTNAKGQQTRGTGFDAKFDTLNNGALVHTINFGGIIIPCHGVHYHIDKPFPQEWFESVTHMRPNMSQPTEDC